MVGEYEAVKDDDDKRNTARIAAGGAGDGDLRQCKQNRDMDLDLPAPPMTW
jgi:hypothetical protein